MTNRKNFKCYRSFLKGVLAFMGLLTMVTGLFGCSKKPEPDIEMPPEFGDDEIYEVGEDFSADGPGEYKKVASLYFGMGGYGPGFTYEIKADEDDESKTLLTCENRDEGLAEMTFEIDDATLESVSKVCEKYNILSWDKFSKSMRGVLDGSGFSLEIDFADGTHISAHGDNSFPKNFSEFEKDFRDVLQPAIDAERARFNEERFADGVFSQPLTMAMINYSGRGASGHDSYSILIREGSSPSTKADISISSASGEFLNAGDYRYYGDPADTDELLAKIQEVLIKYEVYKWDGYNASTPDYADREWFQLNFYYPEASIGAMGCGDTEHYDEVRNELLSLIAEYTLAHTNE